MEIVTPEQAKVQAHARTFAGRTVREFKRCLRRGKYVIWHVRIDPTRLEPYRIMDIRRHRSGEYEVKTLGGGNWRTVKVGSDTLEVR